MPGPVSSAWRALARGFAQAVKEPPAREQVERTLREMAKRHKIKADIRVSGYAPLGESMMAEPVKTVAVRSPWEKGKYDLMFIPKGKGPNEVIVGTSRLPPEEVVPVGLHELGHAKGRQTGTARSGRLAEEARASAWALGRKEEAAEVLGKKPRYGKMIRGQLTYLGLPAWGLD